jgi:predicted RNase H-like HicB family nuclease
MTHYPAVLVTQPSGRWHVHFPDQPGCRAEGSSLEGALSEARRYAADQMANYLTNGSPPTPRNFEQIRADGAWAKARDIDWAVTVITLIPLS